MANTNPKVAIVTGGSRGLGKSMALHIAAKGNDVVLTYNSKKTDAEDVVKQVEATGQKAAALALDVSDSESFGEFFIQLKDILAARWKRDNFDYLINNAGIGIHAAFAQTSEEQFDELVKVHLKGPFFLTQKLLPLIKDGGRIVNISTGLARFTLPGFAAYASMKGGMEVLTRYMAKELGSRGISVNIIAPGAIETDFAGGSIRDNKDLNKIIASQTALGRVGLPDDIGGAVAALLADDNLWISGQRIEVSGGQSL
jgi:NAD(P)-dependent dehydrogenase (short-subunit alcohol dehydrogenase family)